MPAPLADIRADLARMQALAAQVAGQLCPGDVVTLRGEVGAGKTTFARSLIQSIAAANGEEVTSPTFSLMQPYDVLLAGSKPQTLWHLDLYRLEHPDEAQALGLEEMEKAILLIEWPEVLEGRLPPHRLDVHIAMTEEEHTRRVTLAGDESWREKLSLTKAGAA